MTPPPLEYSAPAAEDLLGEGWFGEGSVFDTGEELAGALMALAGGRVAWSTTLPARPPASAPRLSPVDAPVSAPHPAGRGAPPAEVYGEFQVATMPRAPGGEPSGWAGRASAPLERRRTAPGQPRAERGGWSIRQSVQVLRMTEEILFRLREEAAQLTWQLAAAAHRETGAP